MPLDHAFIAQNRRALEHVTQLTNVARPAVRPQLIARLFGQACRRTAHRLSDLLQERLGEQRGVADAVTEGRQWNVEHLQAVKEITARIAAAYQTPRTISLSAFSRIGHPRTNQT